MASLLRALEIRLDGELIGHIGSYRDHNVFIPAPDYLMNTNRRTLSLAFASSDDTVARGLLDTRPSRYTAASQKLPPFFSNLLPEGALRARIAAQLRIHEDNEFDMLAAVGGDLPGAVTATVTDRIPRAVLEYFHNPTSARVSLKVGKSTERFSLSGVQLKFSVLRDPRKRYTLAKETESGSIIVKLPHPVSGVAPRK